MSSITQSKSRNSAEFRNKTERVVVKGFICEQVMLGLDGIENYCVLVHGTMPEFQLCFRFDCVFEYDAKLFADLSSAFQEGKERELAQRWARAKTSQAPESEG